MTSKKVWRDGAAIQPVHELLAAPGHCETDRYATAAKGCGRVRERGGGHAGNGRRAPQQLRPERRNRGGLVRRWNARERALIGKVHDLLAVESEIGGRDANERGDDQKRREHERADERHVRGQERAENPASLRAYRSQTAGFQNAHQVVAGCQPRRRDAEHETADHRGDTDATSTRSLIAIVDTRVKPGGNAAAANLTP